MIYRLFTSVITILVGSLILGFILINLSNNQTFQELRKIPQAFEEVNKVLGG